MDGKINSTSNPVTCTFSSNVFIQANFQESVILDHIYINEFAAGHTGFTDEQGEEEDWIEIFNGNNYAVNIGGLYISDSLNDPSKYRIPTSCPELTTIPPHGYLVLWADNDSEQGPLHLDLKLDNDGEALCLAQKVGEKIVILDSVRFSDQY